MRGSYAVHLRLNPSHSAPKLFNVTLHWNPRDVLENIAAPDFGTFHNSVRRSIRLKIEFVKF